MNKNLVLTGMMGVGKSTIGFSVSKKLKMNFIDIDKMIEEKEKSTINQIFKNKGEKYFREIEEEMTLSKIKNDNTVIALGGGAFINEKIRDAVIQSCISFWLDLDIKLIEGRLKGSKKRPLTKEVDLYNSLNKIYLNRKAKYELANHKINCNENNQNTIMKKIIDLYENDCN